MTDGENKDLALPQAARATHEPNPQAVSALRVGIANAAVWPVFEFRPLPDQMRGTVLRHNGGQWIADDGEHDVAFVCYGAGAPLGLYVDLPFQRNIVWGGLTSHWSGANYDHPRANPWHYMLCEGATEWGGEWGKDWHPNAKAGRDAMNHCCAINSCANGRGPKFEHGDPYFSLGLVRVRETGAVVVPPPALTCMYCGEGWERKLRAQGTSAGTAETGTGSGRQPAGPVGNADAPETGIPVTDPHPSRTRAVSKDTP